ncbi:unnamed protein product [Rangifer tarandus platyrhynchus]|uniref:Uncharacterized protein n=2 Tax=Rangifer tarandus platyrhynchus TaxID=3082113 RepID=A0ABN8ZPB5_RANTA|nr:unnamed protein product [Rangifer tarandus platyrhynchus]CAI9706873.1 unnamed protein product [Rangifer tarandus platyrhynchus]
MESIMWKHRFMQEDKNRITASALARRGSSPEVDLGRDTASGALVSLHELRAGQRPQESDPGRRDSNGPASGFSIPVGVMGLAVSAPAGGILSAAAGAGPAQAVAAATASVCASRPRKRFPVPPPKTASASGGAAERKRCAHAGLALGAGRQARAPREPAAAQYSPEQVSLL